MDLELRLRAALALEDTSDDFIARVWARVDNPRVVDIRSRRRTRVIVFAALTVVGIAAAMFIGRLSGPESGAVDALMSPAPVATTALASAASGPEPETARSPREPGIEQGMPAVGGLPLVPVPAARQADLGKSLLLLQKAVERHPEMVQGPELDDGMTFLVAMTMRPDGEVINSAAELASSANYSEADFRISQTLPVDSGERFNTGFGKGSPIPGGTALRAGVFLSVAFIPDSFDVARSDVRVREILGQKYDDLMSPSSSDEFNLLTVFLSDEGSILREKVARVTMQNADMVMGLATGARQEEAIAAHLGIAVEQIGKVGSTTLGPGSPREVVDEHGGRKIEGARMLLVRYAWARRMDEPASVYAPRRTKEPVADFDLASALIVVEQLLPDAFSHSPPSMSAFQSMPTVVFTARGDVMRTGRVQMRNGVDIDSLLQEQLVPGVPTHLHRIVRLANKAGATGMVQFAWER